MSVPPEVHLPTKRLGQYVGKETVLVCVVSSSPTRICYWERRGEELQTTPGKYRLTIYNDDPHTITLSLQIYQVTAGIITLDNIYTDFNVLTIVLLFNIKVLYKYGKNHIDC